MSSKGTKLDGRDRYRGNRYGGNRGRGDRRQREEDRRQKTQENVDESSPIIQAFLGFQRELDSRNDRHERIVKLSRDITIESKRIIFLLQRVAGSPDKEQLLNEAVSKLEDLHKSKFLPLAQELEGQDAFQFLRAFSPGLQEYVEAVTFYHYLLSDTLVDINKIQSELTFTESNEGALPSALDNSTSVQSTIKQINNLSAADEDSKTNEQVSSLVKDCEDSERSVQEKKDISIETSNKSSCKVVLIPPCEYMLGVADFTGELMRMAINSVGAGDLDTPSVVTQMMRRIHDAFTAFNNTPRELRHKTRVLSQSLQKVERACYTLKVRGSEIPKHMLADVFSSGANATSQDPFTVDDGDYMSD